MRDRFRAGDPSALGEAYDEHARVLYHYAYRVCGDRAAAEDVVSAAFLEAWRCRDRVHADGGSLRPWLLGIATNIMRGAAREARRRDAALARLPERGVLPDFADDVLARMTDGEQVRAARVALGRLRRREREVFTLVVWAGLDYAAAGEALGVPVGTVRSRLSRARERLRKLAEAELRAARRRERSAAVAVRSGRRPAARGATVGGPASGPGGVVRAAAVPEGTASEREPSASVGVLPGPGPDLLDVPGAVPGGLPGSGPGHLDVPGPTPGSGTAPFVGSVAVRSTVRPALAPRPTTENQA
ncbi:RNA polymerase sigma factor [Streptomyces sp. NPDC056361]|uniref:RNA polymerase sigma factor n=1 Tax=Streptomyces sp. NPDC056361 TaxID=3345795 RepID=UPI0035E152A3